LQIYTFYCSKIHIALLAVDKSSNITLIKTIQTSTDIYSICPYEANRFVVGTCQDPRHACIVDLNGQEADFDSVTFPDVTLWIDDSHCTYDPFAEVMVITHKVEDSVQMYQIGSGTSTTLTDDRISRSLGICWGPHGTLYIASSNTGTVFEATTHGEVVRSFDVGMKCPRSISVSKDGSHIVVANKVFGEKRIKLFEIKFL